MNRSRGTANMIKISLVIYVISSWMALILRDGVVSFGDVVAIALVSLLIGLMVD